MRKVTVTILLSVLLLLCSACGKQPDVSSDPQKTASSTTSTAKEGRVLTDSYGREVALPTSIDRIVPLGNAPRMIAYLGLADRVVGIPECEHADTPIMAYAYVNADIWKDLPNVGNDSLGAAEWYAEEIVASNPDLIVCTYEKDVADNIQNQTGIPVVAVTSPALFSDEYNDSLRILADACGVPDRAEELITFIQDCLDDLRHRAQTASDTEKPTVLGAGATFKGSHSIDGVYVNYPVFEILGAKDVASGISDKTGGLLVDREQILLWNPDIIFFDTSSMALVNTEYNEDPTYFEQLKAVQKGELYQWPNSTWHYSNVEIPLVSSYYVGSLLYPEAFDDVDFEAKASEIFDFFLGEPDYLNVLEQAGAGYGKVTLGG